MRNLTVVPVDEKIKKEFINRLNKMFAKGHTVLTIAHDRTIDDIISFLDDDGDVNHLNNQKEKASATETITLPAVTETSFSFTFDEKVRQIPFDHLRIHCERNQIVTQMPDDSDVYIFEKLPSDAELRSSMLSVEPD